MIFLNLLEATQKYELIKEDFITIDTGNKFTLYRIRALRSFGTVQKGDLGGYIQNQSNLDQVAECWVYDHAQVSGNAKVIENAKIYEHAQVYGDAHISGNARIHGNAIISGNARIHDYADISGNVIVDRDAVVFGNTKFIGDIRFSGASVINNLVCQLNNDNNITSLDFLPNINHLIINNCTQITSLDTVKSEHKRITIKNYNNFDIKNIPNSLNNLKLLNVKVIKHLPILAIQPIEINTVDERLEGILPELYKIQCARGASLKLQRMAKMEFQDLLIEADSFSEEEFKI